MTRPPILGIVIALTASLTFLTGCKEPPPPPTAPAPAPVVAVKAEKKTVPVQLRAIGTVRVFATVAIRPRVNGEVIEVHFEEGATVKKGQKLFTIDPRPYQTAHEQAKAQLERDSALLRGAELVLERGERVAAGGSTAVTADEMDRYRTDVASARATVSADRAALRTAELQLMYTTIVSPIEGRTGNFLITPGNLVTSNDPNPLVIINQIAPIAVSFTVPEQYLNDIDANQQKNNGKLAVQAVLRDGSPSMTGELIFFDNSVDSATGTVQLKATFPNNDKRLWPGQFVDVLLTVSNRPNSITVPENAVQEGQSGSFVFVVTPEGTAEVRKVEVAFTANNEAIIAKGLAEGESVIIDGHLRVTPGGKVAVRKTKNEGGSN
jgi:multidrug efflux system membrane fusion protein